MSTFAIAANKLIHPAKTDVVQKSRRVGLTTRWRRDMPQYMPLCERGEVWLTSASSQINEFWWTLKQACLGGLSQPQLRIFRNIGNQFQPLLWDSTTPCNVHLIPPNPALPFDHPLGLSSLQQFPSSAPAPLKWRTWEQVESSCNISSGQSNDNKRQELSNIYDFLAQPYSYLAGHVLQCFWYWHHLCWNCSPHLRNSKPLHSFTSWPGNSPVLPMLIGKHM